MAFEPSAFSVAHEPIGDPGNRRPILPPAAAELAQAAQAMLETLAVMDRHPAVALPMADVATMIALDRDRLAAALAALRA